MMLIPSAEEGALGGEGGCNSKHMCTAKKKTCLPQNASMVLDMLAGPVCGKVLALKWNYVRPGLGSKV